MLFGCGSFFRVFPYVARSWENGVVTHLVTTWQPVWTRWVYIKCLCQKVFKIDAFTQKTKTCLYFKWTWAQVGFLLCHTWWWFLFFFPSAFKEQALHCFLHLILRVNGIDCVTTRVTELATLRDLKDFMSFALFIWLYLSQLHCRQFPYFFCIHLPIQTQFKALITLYLSLSVLA